MVVYNRLMIGSKSSLLPKAGCWFIKSLWLEETAGIQVYWSIALGTHGSVSQPRLHRDTNFRRYLQEKKAHCNLFGQELRTGAADAGLCWQKEPGTSIEREGQQYSYGQHQTPLASPRATARGPAAPVSPWPTTRDRDAGSAALNLILLTLRLSSFLFLFFSSLLARFIPTLTRKAHRAGVLVAVTMPFTWKEAAASWGQSLFPSKEQQDERKQPYVAAEEV